MANFTYKCMDLKNFEVDGVLEAKNIKEATQILNKKYAYVIKIDKSLPAAVAWLNSDAGGNKLNKTELSQFLLQLSSMLNAGIATPTALIKMAKYGDKGVK